MKLIIGSRGSKLALKQTEEVKEKLEALGNDVEIKIISTKGDRVVDQPLVKIGDKSLFTLEIEQQLLNHEVDLAVHSLKDMPSVLPSELMITDTILSNDYRDCLVLNHKYHSIDELPKQAIIGTGSLRRKVQLLNLYPNFIVKDIRGNVTTRLNKLDESYDALVLAAAGLNRLNIDNYACYYFSEEEMIPACGQGILCIECRKDHKELLSLISMIKDNKTTERMRLERSFIEAISGDCTIPIGGYADVNHHAFYAIYGNHDGQYTKEKIILESNSVEQIQQLAKRLKENYE